jgi:hypothetical protein
MADARTQLVTLSKQYPLLDGFCKANCDCSAYKTISGLELQSRVTNYQDMKDNCAARIQDARKELCDKCLATKFMRSSRSR